MNIWLIAFTTGGANICRRLMKLRSAAGDRCGGFRKGSFPGGEGLICVEGSLNNWAADAFARQDAVIFVGATGIAVRAIAPYLKSKTSDPAVLAVDERGTFVIPLVSGHIGGANKLAAEIAREIGATPVITTATDINGIFAVDQWARENCLKISDMKLARQISAELLQGKKIGFATTFSIMGNLPRGLTYGKSHLNIELSAAEKPLWKNTLRLTPRCVILGIGCRRGISAERIGALVKEVLSRENISREAVCGAASIDLKEDEPGLMEFCRELGIPFQVYSKEELLALEGNFTASSFVSSVAGVDNVCERAALLAAGRGKLAVKKQVKDGVTLAIAMKSLTYNLGAYTEGV